MMIYPEISKLVQKAGDRYSLVMGVAKRARELASGADAVVYNRMGKDVTTAIEELNCEKMRILHNVAE